MTRTNGTQTPVRHLKAHLLALSIASKLGMKRSKTNQVNKIQNPTSNPNPPSSRTKPSTSASAHSKT
jgi:hypothetical protein